MTHSNAEDSHAPTSVDESMNEAEGNGAAAMSRAQLEESKEYGRRELQCTLIDMLLDITYLGVMACVAAIVIDRYLYSWPLLENRWYRLVAFYLITMLLHYVISFPLALYSSFLLEHQYKLSRQSFGRWLWRYLLQNFLAIAFGLVLVLGLFAIIWMTGPWWWLVAAVATFGVTIVMGQLVPVLILPLFYKIERLEDDSLVARLEDLTAGTSLNLEGVFRMKMSSETVKANALLAGLGRTRRVILGDTLLDEFSPEEIEVVFAHEVGHHIYRHIPKLILLGLVTSVVSFYLCDRILVAWVQIHESTFAYGQVPVYTLPMLLLVITLFSLLLSPLRNGLSRRFEVACDQYALQRTRDPRAYRSAFQKLAQLNKSDPDPNRWEVLLLHDHPPVAARLALADDWVE